MLSVLRKLGVHFASVLEKQHAVQHGYRGRFGIWLLQQLDSVLKLGVLVSAKIGQILGFAVNVLALFWAGKAFLPSICRLVSLGSLHLAYIWSSPIS